MSREEQDSRELNREQNRLRDYRRSLTAHRVRRILTRVLLAGAVICALYFGIRYYQSRHYSSMEMSPAADYIAADGASYRNLGETIVEYTSNGATCLDTAGRVLWQCSFEMEEPIVSTAGNVIAFADYNGRSVYVMNTSGELGHFTTAMDVHYLSAAENGDVLCVMDSGTSAWIRLYSVDGREKAYFVRNIDESGYPLAAALSPDGETVCISNLMMEGASVKTVLSFYDFAHGSEENSYEVSSYAYKDEVVPVVRFLNDQVCTAVSDARLMYFDVSGNAPVAGMNSMFSEQVQSLFFGDERIGLLFMDETGNEMYRLDLYDLHGSRTGSIRFSLNYTDVQLTGGRIFINNAQYCMIYAEDGREIFSGAFSRSVRVLHASKRLRNLCALTGKELEEIELH
ncbi:MAG: hypothetical protein IKG66_03245 [Lachnospiraceae bacterium]|nr:hypothetical protein [Lachnospiraceae bacterium]